MAWLCGRRYCRGDAKRHHNKCHARPRHNPKQYLNIDRAAEYCGISTKTLRRAIRSRRFAFFRPGRAYMSLTQDLDAFMNATRFGVVVFGKAA